MMMSVVSEPVINWQNNWIDSQQKVGTCAFRILNNGWKIPINVWGQRLQKLVHKGTVEGWNKRNCMHSYEAIPTPLLIFSSLQLQ